MNETILQILGGFGLFVYAINYLSEILNNNKEKILKGTKLNNKTVFIFSFLITLLCQSSSATTAIAISLIKAKVINLKQATSMIVAANIATTITPFILLINLQNFSLLFIFFGGLFKSVVKERYKSLFSFVLAIGLLFYGLQTMSNSLNNLTTYPMFIKTLNQVDEHPLFISTLLTSLIQSSSISIGVLQQSAICDNLQTSSLILFVYGCNVGTTMTAILVSLGNDIDAKKTAIIHLLFNCIGVVIGLLLLSFTTEIFDTFKQSYTMNTSVLIALTHLVFNIQTSLLFIPLINPIITKLNQI